MTIIMINAITAILLAIAFSELKVTKRGLKTSLSARFLFFIPFLKLALRASLLSSQVAVVCPLLAL